MGGSHTLRHRSRGQRGGQRGLAARAEDRALRVSGRQLSTAALRIAAARRQASLQMGRLAVARQASKNPFSSQPAARGVNPSQNQPVEVAVESVVQKDVRDAIDRLTKNRQGESDVVKYREGLPQRILPEPNIALSDTDRANLAALSKVLEASQERVLNATKVITSARERIAEIATQKITAQEKKVQEAVALQNLRQAQQIAMVAATAANAARERLSQTMDLQMREQLVKAIRALSYSIRGLSNQRILSAIGNITKIIEGTPSNTYLNTKIAELQHQLEPLNTTNAALNANIFDTRVVLDYNSPLNVEVTPDLTPQINEVNAKLEKVRGSTAKT